MIEETIEEMKERHRLALQERRKVEPQTHSWRGLNRLRLVYQGGHHNVFCDGYVHISTTGGTHCAFGWIPISLYKCDCEKWGNPPDLNLLKEFYARHRESP